MSSADHEQRWGDLIRRYYNGCTAGDADLMCQTLHAEVVHWFLSPNPGSGPVIGALHLARYWCKVQRMKQARWVVDTICASDSQAVVEWTMFWLPSDSDVRIATRGAEWFTDREGLIGEIRSYYQLRPETSELAGFPYPARGYSVVGSECSELHPGADGISSDGAGPGRPPGSTSS